MRLWRHNLVFATTVTVLLAATLAAILFTQQVFSQSDTVVIEGWAWSDNIGWVSLQGPGYGFVYDTGTGVVSGYAWSEHIGWVSANSSDTAAVCGSGGARLKGENFSGFLRTLAGGTVQSGGWDGCISLRGSGYGVTTADNPAYNPAVSGAWGSDVVGWLAFNLQATETSPPELPDLTEPVLPLSGCLSTAPLPTCQDSRRVRQGETAMLYWDVQNATECTLSGPGAPGAVDVSGQWQTSAMQNQTRYTLSCNDGAFTDTATINIIPVVQEI